MTGRPRPRKTAASSPRDESPEYGGTGSGTEPPGPAGGGYGNEPPDGDDGEAVGAHAEFVERHFGGGAEATPELLDRAMEVWQRLPGAVVRGPAQIRPNRPAPPAGTDEDATS